jgi:hypothetical protein
VGQLADAIRRAQEREDAHNNARLAFNDAKLLRLQILKDEVSAIIAASSLAHDGFDPSISPGEPPHLWIGLTTSVVMEPDPKTYRLLQDTQAGREVLLETADRAEMVEQIKQVMAHLIIARERQRIVPTASSEGVGRHAIGWLFFAWLMGFGFGLLSLIAAAIYLKILHF